MDDGLGLVGFGQIWGWGRDDIALGAVGLVVKKPIRGSLSAIGFVICASVFIVLGSGVSSAGSFFFIRFTSSRSAPIASTSP
jgi:hypothetical protein